MKQLPILFGHACLVMLFIIFALIYQGKREQQQPLSYMDYIVNVTDDTIRVYHNDFSFVGKVKLEGQLDSLITDDNQ